MSEGLHRYNNGDIPRYNDKGPTYLTLPKKLPQWFLPKNCFSKLPKTAKIFGLLFVRKCCLDLSKSTQSGHKIFYKIGPLDMRKNSLLLKLVNWTKKVWPIVSNFLLSRMNTFTNDWEAFQQQIQSRLWYETKIFFALQVEFLKNINRGGKYEMGTKLMTSPPSA